jgi:hypothetical protein
MDDIFSFAEVSPDTQHGPWQQLIGARFDGVFDVQHKRELRQLGETVRHVLIKRDF